MRRAAAVILALGLVGCTGAVEEAATTVAPSTTTTAPTTTTSSTTTNTTATVTSTTVITLAPSTTSLPPVTTASGDSPCDAPNLDALYYACASGDWVACDDLFRSAPAWSPCQRFGDTCGWTTTTPHDARCQDLYAGVNLPTTDWPGLP